MARHCPELFAKASPTQAPDRFGEAIADFTRRLGASLGGLVGGARLSIRCSEAESLAPASLAERVAPLAANSLYTIPSSGVQIVASIGLADLLAMTDRVFGGEGERPEILPEELPLTADLVASQVEGLIAEALGGVVAPLEQPTIVARSATYARLDPFGTASQCRHFAVTVIEPDRWEAVLLFAMSSDCFAKLFAQEPRPVRAAAANDPLSGPFGDLPLELEALVAQFSMPLARLSSLKPGDTIPLVLSREVPLNVSETTIAYGSVGAADERVALQLTRAA